MRGRCEDGLLNRQWSPALYHKVCHTTVYVLHIYLAVGFISASVLKASESSALKNVRFAVKSV